ncbi:MAG: 4-hydroxy-3-methylbut-2-en-1-yl diphosphate synthase [Omnitrophica WOR_2 bacterium SM23_29]|nr:MAG: 4-hydroxy-3-methylbut-2-en-1-yl diphosphate synthase [Omnitrophica WOR_2 bacterium SM23_29]
MQRRKTKTINLGSVKIGSGYPISVQSMTKTDTSNVKATVAQIKRLQKAGCEIIRIAVKDRPSCDAISEIRRKIDIPLEADIHFDYRLALKAMECGVDAIRLNPGNIYKVEQVEEVVRLACKKRIPIRVGVNSGSVRIPKGKVISKNKFPDLMVKAAADYIRIMENLGFCDIMVSLKASDVMGTIEAYRRMATACDYPFHLGVTAAGPLVKGTVKSSLGIGILLMEGIGDTLRVSLTGDSVDEVYVAKEILQSLGLRNFGPEIISCPTCGRTEVDIIKITSEVENSLNRIKDEKGRLSKLRVAIMGCVVNGPGEAKEADFGIAAGKGGGLLFVKGKPIKKIKESEFTSAIISEIKRILN